MAPETEPFEPGRDIGPYEILRELGRGGMGRVYLAKDTSVGGRFVAIKVILDEGARDSNEARLRFEREIKNLARLRHPNIITVFTAGVHEGHPFFVMDYIPGRDLGRYLDELTSLGEAERIQTIAKVMASVARAVQYAHSKETVHRDLKPANILITTEADEAMILDFGIAKYLGDTSLTKGQGSPGTPQYRAPEQIDINLKLRDELVDVWALGVILYRALCGTQPFKGNDIISLCANIVHNQPIAPRALNSKIPAALEKIVLDCLEKDPRRRVASPEALAERLEALNGPTGAATRRPALGSGTVTGAGGPSARRSRLLVGGLAVVLLAVAAWAVVHFMPTTTGRGDSPSGEPKSADSVPVLVLRRADGSAVTNGAAVEIDGPELFTLVAEDASPLSATSLTQEGFTVVNVESAPRGQRWTLRPSRVLIEDAITLRVEDPSRNLASFSVKLARKLPQPLARLISVEGRGVKENDAAPLVVKGWEADVEVSSDAIAAFPERWTLRLLGSAGESVVEAPLKVTSELLVARLTVPVSARTEASAFTLEAVLWDSKGTTRTASFATPRVEFDGQGPTVVFERRTGATWRAVSGGVVEVPASSDVRVRVDDRHGPIALSVGIDTPAAEPAASAIASGETRALFSGLIAGRHAVAAAATDALGNVATATLDLTITPPGTPRPEMTALAWAEVLDAEPDAKVVTDLSLRDQITETKLPWRVKDKSSGIEMVLIPPGSYQRGMSSWDAEADSSERPAHRVTLSKAFYLGRYAVTNAEYRRFKADHDSGSYRGQAFSADNRQPVVMVSWEDVSPVKADGSANLGSFCGRHGLRLPTAGEWEYACRAGATGPRYGNLDAIAWYDKNSGSVTHPVGQKQANGFGLYDMLGNVWQWCSDWYGSSEYRGLTDGVTDPGGPTSGTSRVVRGGSWYGDSEGCRASARNFYGPSIHGHYLGLRVARTP